MAAHLGALPEALQSYLAPYLNGTGPALPASLPAASLEPLVGLLTHLHTQAVHPALPFTRFALLHAARVAVVWTGATRARTAGVGFLQDLVGYLTMAWGGATAVALLLHQPPPWLVSPLPVVLYTAVFALLFRTGASRLVLSASPTLLSLLGAAVDALTRGSSVAALPAVLDASGVPATWWTTAVLGAVGTGAGGWLAQALGMGRDEWALARPAVLDGTLLATLDATSAAAAALLHAALTRRHAELAPLGDAVNTLAGRAAGKVVDEHTARAATVAFLAVVLVGRAALLAVRGGAGKAGVAGAAKAAKAAKAKAAEAVESAEKVAKTPASKGVTQPRERRTTPRRSKTPA